MLNYPLIIVASVWLIWCGAWKFTLAAIGAALIGPYFMGIFTYPVMLLMDSTYKTSHLRGLKLFVSSIWHWIGASIWGFIVITNGINYGTLLDVSLFPVMGLCLAVTSLPFYNVLSDTLRANEDEAGLMLIVITIFVELAAFLSLTIFYLYAETLQEIKSITLYVFLAFGIIEVPIYYKFLSLFVSDFIFKSLISGKHDK